MSDQPASNSPRSTATVWEHGPIGVASGAYHLQHSDGTPFFYLADTAWNGPLLAGESDWNEYLRNRAAKRFSAIQFIMTPWAGAYTDADGQSAFTLNSKLVINPDFFRRMDRRLDAINAAGLLAVPVLLWAANFGDSGKYNPGQALAPDHLLTLARYMIDRYQDRHVLWILAGDGHYGWRNRGRWKWLGRALFGDRPHAPVAMHPMGLHWPARSFQHERWLDIHGYQTSHNDNNATLCFLHRGGPARHWHRAPARPIINFEPCYEGIRNFNRSAVKPIDADDVRKAVYASLLNTPTAGVTYGAHGVWSWEATANEPLNHRGVGIAQPWREAMAFAGSDDMCRMATLFISLPWWKLRPVQWLARQPDLPSHISTSATDDGRVVAYFPAGGRMPLPPNFPVAHAEWFNPRTGERHAAYLKQNACTAPDPLDWVLIAQRV